MLLTNRNNLKVANLLFGSFDIIVTTAALLLSFGITNRYGKQHIAFNSETQIIAGILVVCWFVLLKVTHLARIPRTMSYAIIFYDFLKISLLAGLILLGLDALISTDNFPAFTIILFIGLTSCLLYIVRLATYKFFKIYRAHGHNLRNVVIIAGDEDTGLIEKIYSQKEWGFRILCVITDSAALRKKYHGRIKLYPTAINIKSIVQYDIVDEIICLGCEQREKIYTLIDFCRELGVTFRLKSLKAMNLDTHYKSRIQYFDKVPFHTIENNPNNRFSHIIKYLTEFIMAFGVLFVMSPLLMIIAILIALSRPV